MVMNLKQRESNKFKTKDEIELQQIRTSWVSATIAWCQTERSEYESVYCGINNTKPT